MKPLVTKKKYSTTFSEDTLSRFQRACRLRCVRSNAVLEQAMIEFIEETKNIFQGKEVEI